MAALNHDGAWIKRWCLPLVLGNPTWENKEISNTLTETSKLGGAIEKPVVWGNAGAEYWHLKKADIGHFEGFLSERIFLQKSIWGGN